MQPPIPLPDQHRTGSKLGSLLVKANGQRQPDPLPTAIYDQGRAGLLPVDRASPTFDRAKQPARSRYQNPAFDGGIARPREHGPSPQHSSEALLSCDLTATMRASAQP